MRNYIAFLLALLAIAVVLRVSFFFTVFFFLAGTYVLARLWIHQASRNVRVSRSFTDRAFTGDDVDVTLTVENRGLLPVPWLRLGESVPVHLLAAPFPAQVISLGPRGRKVFTYRLRCHHRGYYRIGPLSLEAGDLLGIETTVLPPGPAHRMIVYPRVVPIRKLGLPTHSPLVSLPATSRLFEDPSRVMGVRDYHRGDSPRRIHWTATARASKLVVKQYQPAIARETMIFLDLDREHYGLHRRYEATETAISAAASIASHVILQEGLPAGLVTRGLDPLVGEVRTVHVPPRSERAHLMANVLELLARIEATDGGDFAGLVERQSAGLSWGATVVAITGERDPGLTSALLQLRRGGFAVSLVVVDPRRGPASREWEMGAGSVPSYTVWEDEDLEVLA